MQALQALAVDLRRLLDGLATAFAEGEIDREQLRAGSTRLKARLAAVNEQMADQAVTPVFAGLVRAEDVKAAWELLDLDRHRAVIDALLTVQLQSPGRGARTFDPSTVQITWKTG